MQERRAREDAPFLHRVSQGRGLEGLTSSEGDDGERLHQEQEPRRGGLPRSV